MFNGSNAILARRARLCIKYGSRNGTHGTYRVAPAIFHYPLITTHCYLAKYPVLARTLIPSRFGLITIFRNVSSFSGSSG